MKKEIEKIRIELASALEESVIEEGIRPVHEVHQCFSNVSEEIFKGLLKGVAVKKCPSEKIMNLLIEEYRLKIDLLQMRNIRRSNTKHCSDFSNLQYAQNEARRTIRNSLAQSDGFGCAAFLEHEGVMNVSE